MGRNRGAPKNKEREFPTGTILSNINPSDINAAHNIVAF